MVVVHDHQGDVRKPSQPQEMMKRTNPNAEHVQDLDQWKKIQQIRLVVKLEMRTRNTTESGRGQDLGKIRIKSETHPQVLMMIVNRNREGGPGLKSAVPRLLGGLKGKIQKCSCTFIFFPKKCGPYLDFKILTCEIFS